MLNRLAKAAEEASAILHTEVDGNPDIADARTFLDTILSEGGDG